LEVEDAEDQLEDDEPVSLPTYSEYRTAVDVVKRFVTCTSSNPQDIAAVQTLEHLLFTMKRQQQQTTLDSFRSAIELICLGMNNSYWTNQVYTHVS
jgi:hypothetical protein